MPPARNKLATFGTAIVPAPTTRHGRPSSLKKTGNISIEYTALVLQNRTIPLGIASVWPIFFRANSVFLKYDLKDFCSFQRSSQTSQRGFPLCRF
jgi:hypothetical protein